MSLHFSPMTHTLLLPINRHIPMLAAAMMIGVTPAHAQRGGAVNTDSSLAAFRVDTAATSLPTRVRSTRRGSVPGAAATVEILWARNLSAWLIDGRTGRVLTKRSLGEPHAERP